MTYYKPKMFLKICSQSARNAGNSEASISKHASEPHLGARANNTR